MEPFTLDRKFLPQDEIDKFHSLIWTERYYGDSEVELVVPATSDMIKKLPLGIFLGIPESKEIMILETMTIEGNNLKLLGISLLPWLNNRFIRTSDKHEDKNWYLEGGPPGWILWAIIWNMCINDGSPFLNGSIPIGISNPERLAIPGLRLKDYDKSGENIGVTVPFGPVYNAMLEIAVTYKIGMQITLESATDTSYSLGFRSYKGLERISAQSEHIPVRFSPQTNSLTDIKELQSIAALKTLVYAFASELDPEDGLTTVPGMDILTGSQYTGFDLRALMLFASEITTDTFEGDQAALVDILNKKAFQGMVANPFIKAVDGEIVPTNQFKYGVDYNLGDIIEIQGNSEIVSTARVMEYIRAQDEAGERAYPTVTMLD